MKILNYLKATFEAEYTNLNSWYFISFISAIIVYFSLGFDLNFSTIAIILFTFLILFISKKLGAILQFLCGLIIAFILGLSVSKYRTANVHGGTLDKPIISKISGKIESIKPTIIGGQVVFSEIKIERINDNLAKVKISIPKKYLQEIRVNDYITLLAKLYKPQNSILPGGYDFGFYAYLSDIGANGYAMSKPEIIERKETTIDSFIYKVRIFFTII